MYIIWNNLFPNEYNDLYGESLYLNIRMVNYVISTVYYSVDSNGESFYSYSEKWIHMVNKLIHTVIQFIPMVKNRFIFVKWINWVI